MNRGPYSISICYGHISCSNEKKCTICSTHVSKAPKLLIERTTVKRSKDRVQGFLDNEGSDACNVEFDGIGPGGFLT